MTYTHTIAPRFVSIRFPEKPPDDVRSILKAHGFRWSPQSGAWSRNRVTGAADVFSAHGPAVEAESSLSPTDFSIRFFLQLAIIIATCRVVGWIGQKLLGQPQVVGEMIAGVVLGPSLLGLLFPDFSAAVFPKETKSVLYAGAQFGVGLYTYSALLA